jgi:hypothetical protein
MICFLSAIKVKELLNNPLVVNEEWCHELCDCLEIIFSSSNTHQHCLTLSLSLSLHSIHSHFAALLTSHGSLLVSVLNQLAVTHINNKELYERVLYHLSTILKSSGVSSFSFSFLSQLI